MKRFLVLPLFILSLYASGQYDPSKATVTNKPLGIAQAVPTDARSYYYSPSLFIWRPYQSTAEVLATLNITKYRVGHFPIYVNVGGALQSNGSFVGGTIKEYWFKDGTADGDLVEKVGGGGVAESTSGTVSQLRALTTTSGKAYTSTDRGGGTWVDIGLFDGQVVDDGATYIVTTAGRILKRQIDDEVYPEWWGAVASDGISDTAAFGKMTRYCLSSGKNISLNQGTYTINGTWNIPGRADNSGILVTGAGGIGSTIDLGASNAAIGIKYGSAATNTLHGGISKIRIISKPTIDALTISSHAPYSAAFNRFEDIYIFNTRDGVNFDMDPGNETSCYHNTFSNIEVERYFRYGFYANGAYNDHYGLFIVQPNGETNTVHPDTTKGALTLGLLNHGSSQRFFACQFEDQIYSYGGNCLWDGVTIENMLKGKPHPFNGNVAFVVSGVNNTIRNFQGITLNKTAINTLANFTTTNTTVDGITYTNPGNDTNFILKYPVLTSETEGSGVMVNANVPAQFMQDGIPSNTWSYVNVLGSKGLFSTVAKNTLTFNDVILKNRNATAEPLFKNNIQIGTYNDRKIVNMEGGIDFHALGAPIARVTSNNQDTYRGGVSLQYTTDQGGRATANLVGDSVQSITVSSPGVYTDTPLVIINDPGEVGFGATARAVLTGTSLTGIVLTNKGKGYIDPPNVFIVQYKDGLKLDYTGSGFFANTASGKPAVADSNFVTLAQMRQRITDSLTARYNNTAFTFRNGLGSGSQLMTANVPNQAIIKTFDLTGVGVSRDINNDSTLKYSIGTSVSTVSSAATVTPSFTENGVKILAQAVPLTIANPTGTPQSFQRITIRVKDNGTPQSITFGSQYRGIGVTLPTTTVAGKLMYLEAIVNLDEGVGVTMLDVIQVRQQP